MVQPASRSVDFSHAPKALHKASSSQYLGPGTYENPIQFGSSLNKITLGAKKSYKINETPAPGQYSPQRADKHTMSKSKSTDFIRRIGRVQPKVNADNGPGTYSPERSFGA